MTASGGGQVVDWGSGGCIPLIHAGRMMQRIPHTALLVLAICLCSPWSVHAAGNDRINVLFISSFPKDIPAQANLERGLKGAFSASEENIDLFFEFMDMPRLGSFAAPKEFADYLEAKYSAREPQVIVGWAHDAMDFIHNQAGLFPQAHRLYLEVLEDYSGELRDNESVIVPENDYLTSLRETLRLESPRRVVVIGTTHDETARKRLATFENLMAELAPDIALDHLIDQDLESVAAHLADLPRKGTMAFYLLMFSDGQGMSMAPYDVARHLAARSSIPIYSYWESLVGSGVVGGYQVSQYAMGDQLGRIILARRQGREAGTISPMRWTYDWAALRKHGIDDKRIPGDVTYVNQPAGLPRRFYWYIAAVIAFGAIEFLLIAYLVVNRQMRRRAEIELQEHHDHLEEVVASRTRELGERNQDLQDSETRLRTLSDASFEGILLLEDGVIVDANTTLLGISGYAITELVGRHAGALVPGESVSMIEDMTRREQPFPFESAMVKKDGTKLPVMIRARTIAEGERHVWIVAIHDLTKEKAAEQEIQTLKGIIPICMHCKGIRNDAGYWSQLEEYIESHSEAQFSHGICDQCLVKHYGMAPGGS